MEQLETIKHITLFDPPPKKPVLSAPKNYLASPLKTCGWLHVWWVQRTTRSLTFEEKNYFPFISYEQPHCRVRYGWRRGQCKRSHLGGPVMNCTYSGTTKPVQDAWAIVCQSLMGTLHGRCMACWLVQLPRYLSAQSASGSLQRTPRSLVTAPPLYFPTGLTYESGGWGLQPPVSGKSIIFRTNAKFVRAAASSQ